MKRLSAVIFEWKGMNESGSQDFEAWEFEQVK
jgi:hypothetical protein